MAESVQATENTVLLALTIEGRVEAHKLVDDFHPDHAYGPVERVIIERDMHSAVRPFDITNANATVLEGSEDGLYGKYAVYEDGKPVDDCFVLEPKSDKTARRAIEAYIQHTDNEALEEDLRGWLASIEIEEL